MFQVDTISRIRPTPLQPQKTYLFMSQDKNEVAEVAKVLQTQKNQGF